MLPVTCPTGTAATSTLTWLVPAFEMRSMFLGAFTVLSRFRVLSRLFGVFPHLFLIHLDGPSLVFLLYIDISGVAMAVADQRVLTGLFIRSPSRRAALHRSHGRTLIASFPRTTKPS